MFGTLAQSGVNVNTANTVGFAGNTYTRDREERGLLVFTGNSNRPLAMQVCHELNVPLGKALCSRFSDGEVQVEIEENVRRQEVFVMQSTAAPTADNFMELLVLVDALKRASAASVTAVIPYFGYARQDRRPRSARVPILRRRSRGPARSTASARGYCGSMRSRSDCRRSSPLTIARTAPI